MELSDNLYWINIIPDMLQKKCRKFSLCQTRFVTYMCVVKVRRKYASFNLWFLDIWKRFQVIVWDLFTAKIGNLVVSTLKPNQKKTFNSFLSLLIDYNNICNWRCLRVFIWNHTPLPAMTKANGRVTWAVWGNKRLDCHKSRVKHITWSM